MIAKRRLRWLGFLSIKKGEFIATYNYRIGEYRGDGLRFLSEVHSKRMRGNRHRLEHGKFHLSIRDKFVMQAVKHKQAMSGCGIPIFGMWNLWSCSKLEGIKFLSNPI